MNNSQAMAYACVALANLKKRNIEITTLNLKSEMHHLMDEYTEEAICDKYCNEGE